MRAKCTSKISREPAMGKRRNTQRLRYDHTSYRFKCIAYSQGLTIYLSMGFKWINQRDPDMVSVVVNVIVPEDTE